MLTGVRMLQQLVWLPADGRRQALKNRSSGLADDRADQRRGDESAELGRDCMSRRLGCEAHRRRRR